MSYIITFLVSLIEWGGLISFPLIFLGYKYKNYIKSIIIQSALMSFLSIFLHAISLPIPVIVGIQIIILITLIKFGLKTNNIEAITLTSIGYGFYLFLQLLIIELYSSILQGSYVKLFKMSNVSVIIPVITISLLLIFCYILYRNKLQISELRYQLKADNLDKKIKRMIQALFVMTYIFICVGTAVMMVDKQVKYSFVLLSIIVLFGMMLCYLILHSQLQMKQLLHAKKYYLDQEQQIATFVEKLKQEYVMHFRAIEKLNHSGSPSIITEYMDTHQLQQINNNWKKRNFREGMEGLDPLLFSFFNNKRKLADLLEVEMVIKTQISSEEFTSLSQIRNLSLIIDDLILSLFQAASDVQKLIHINIEITDKYFSYTIAANLFIDPINTDLGLFDAIIKLKQNKATVDIVLDPVSVKILIPVI
ncbi:hypothetical protein [Niallia sp. 01092]|uniref:hypothetical protein n=1 Tax=unclassified Niallia TaxID=2837522 RepID=UPI003FD0B1A2